MRGVSGWQYHYKRQQFVQIVPFRLVAFRKIIVTVSESHSSLALISWLAIFLFRARFLHHNTTNLNSLSALSCGFYWCTTLKTSDVRHLPLLCSSDAPEAVSGCSKSLKQHRRLQQEKPAHNPTLPPSWTSYFFLRLLCVRILRGVWLFSHFSSSHFPSFRLANLTRKLFLL